MLFFVRLPSQVDLQALNNPSTRLTTFLSYRDVLASQALEVIAQNPILGIGPMHFADSVSAGYTHPHQSLLQWGAEWGLVSLAMVVWFVAAALKKLLKLLRQDCDVVQWTNHLRLCLAASILAGLMLSMVDGVFVMPVAQTWFAILLGWLLALSSESHAESRPHAERSFALLAPFLGLIITLLMGVAAATISVKVYADKNLLAQRHENYLKQGIDEVWHPRFWSDGFIVWD